MPITLTVPEGLLSPQAQAEAFSGLTDALLEISGLDCVFHELADRVFSNSRTLISVNTGQGFR